jgi:hypothetical protein
MIELEKNTLIQTGSDGGLSLRTSVMNVLMSSNEKSVLLSEAATCPYANDWTLNCCCNSVQIQTIVAVAVYSVLIFFLWDTIVLAPLKLVTVAIHEFGHASAAW